MIKPAYRMLTEPDPRLLWNFCYNFGWKGMRAVQKFEKRRKKGEKLSPAFIFISLTDACNLRCQGCWVGADDHKPRTLNLEQLNDILAKGRKMGVHFYGILGGEPLMHPDLIELFETNQDCYFQLFTNGTLLNEDFAKKLRKCGNVTPLISIEGLEEVSDVRRGGNRVYERSMRALEACKKERLIFGIATSVCKSNINDLVSERFVKLAAQSGAQYLWYYIYRPVGPRPMESLALSHDEILRLRQFMVDMRKRAPLAIVDAYWDHKGNALCPAATGISHHIGPAGDIEPCPPIQFARENLEAFKNDDNPFGNSEFMHAFREFSSKTTRGCVLLEAPDKLHAFLKEQGANDTSGRDTGYEELAKMQVLPGHHMPGEEIPEKSLFYYFAKKYWFFGFGAYG